MANPDRETPGGTGRGSREYDNDRMLKSVHTQSVTYKPATLSSELTTLVASTTVNGLTESYEYNQFGELQSLHARFGTETRLKIDYEPLSGSARIARDNLGRVVEREDTIGSEVKRFKYAYDGAGRLTDVYEYAGDVAKRREQYVYGLNGTRTSVSKYTAGVLTSTKSAFYNDQDQLETFDGAKYTYLPSGELSTKEVGGTIVEQYEWDAHGNLLAVVFPTATGTALKRIDYIVDPLGHRVGKKETRGTLAAVLTRRWLWDGSLRIVGEDELARWDGTTSSYASKQIKTAYLYAGRPNVPALAVRKDLSAGTTETYRILTDQLGSVRLVVNAATGQTVQRVDYDAYGVVELDTIAIGWTAVPFGFAGGLYDRDTKLVRFGERDYDAVTGRWISKDPIGFDGGEADLNGYVGNDPVNFTDPTGLYTEIVFWEPVGWGASSFGHVSVEINGTSYSWGPGGMDIRSAAEFNRKNAFRYARGLVLGLTDKQEAAFVAHLRGYSATHSGYKVLENNCTDPPQSGLRALGLLRPDASFVLPNSFARSLSDIAVAQIVHECPEHRPMWAESDARWSFWHMY